MGSIGEGRFLLSDGDAFLLAGFDHDLVFLSQTGLAADQWHGFLSKLYPSRDGYIGELCRHLLQKRKKLDAEPLT